MDYSHYDFSLFAKKYQRNMYKQLKFQVVNRELDRKDELEPYYNALKMQCTMVEYRKIVNHPYLIHWSYENLISENLVKESGKMMVLDAMLPKLKKKGHKVIINIS